MGVVVAGVGVAVVDILQEIARFRLHPDIFFQVPELIGVVGMVVDWVKVDGILVVWVARKQPVVPPEPASVLPVERRQILVHCSKLPVEQLDKNSVKTK